MHQHSRINSKFRKKRLRLFFCLTLFTFTLLFGFSFTSTNADTASDIKAKINAKNDEIKKLEAEIAQYEQSLNQTSSKAKSLANELATLNLSKKKLETELKATEANLSKTSAMISDLSTQISDTESKINHKKTEISQNLNSMRDADSTSPVEILLSGSSIADISNYLEDILKLSESLRTQVSDLKGAQNKLSDSKSAQVSKQSELKKLKNDLSGQQKAVVDNANTKNKLLSDTKNQESNYQKILKDKVALRAQFEQELYDYESALKLSVDKGLLPSSGSAPLSWPLSNVFITQLFGKTSASGRLYASGTHNGIDLRASEGTPVHAALSGTVTATGNTDLKQNCYSYGKWVLLKHPNGLSTLYGHLSSVSVSPGDAVSTGDTIAYSGHTGYATGPHLHLTVFATQGMRVMTYPPEKAINCGGVVIPIADPSAFLDPIQYLPPVPRN